MGKKSQKRVYCIAVWRNNLYQVQSPFSYPYSVLPNISCRAPSAQVLLEAIMFGELLIMPNPVLLLCFACQKPLPPEQNTTELYHDNCWQPVCQSCTHQLAPKLNFMANTVPNGVEQELEQGYILPNIGLSSFGSLWY